MTTRVIIVEVDSNLDSVIAKLNKQLEMTGEEIVSTSPAGNRVLVTVKKVGRSLKEVPQKTQRILLD